MRPIDADELSKVKFHPLPYTHIVPADLLKEQTEAYERGWNDAIDAIIENAETVEPQWWIPVTEQLPEKRGTYIVSVDGCVFPANYYPGGTYDGTTTWSDYHWTDLETGILQNDPDAWCELPEPWKGEADGILESDTAGQI